jgi:hypothetical protein
VRRCTTIERSPVFVPKCAKNRSPLTAGAQALHVTSTGFPQRGGSLGPRSSYGDAPPRLARAFALALLVCLTGGVAARAQITPPQTPPPDPAPSTDPGPIFRVFLADGRALASYGECAVVGDRVVFTLSVGDGGLGTEYQLMSLPASAVDLDRTTRYRDAVRARRYAATRGEADYAAMTAEVSRSLDELRRISNPARRLDAAEEARRRLLAWSEANYHYRAKDIQDLVGLIDDVIAELRAAAGDAKLSISLVAGPAAGREEPIRAAPSLRESIELALAAAMVADVSTDRTAILRAAAAASAGVDDLSAEVTRRVEDDQAAHRLYATMRADALARTRQALSVGDVGAVDAVRNEAIARERALAVRRPDEMLALLEELDAVRDRTRAHRLALDRYALMRPQLFAYERALRPVFSAIEGARPVLGAIHDMKGPAVAALVLAESHLGRIAPILAKLAPPEDLSDVQATLLSAVHLAVEACKRRRVALAAGNTGLAREASASAAGAGMLADQARQSLVTRLFPPVVR